MHRPGAWTLGWSCWLWQSVVFVGSLAPAASVADAVGGPLAQTLTEQLPPPAAGPNVNLIPDVPSYIWHHGCGPTAAGMIIGYWNAAFNKWHDDGDRLFEYDEFTSWMDLPDPPDV